MTWIKTEDLLPPTHEIILFQDVWRNQHYGVLCGKHAPLEKRNEFWCHIFNKSYDPDDILYWSAIPINQNLLIENSEFSGKVNEFLWETITKIEKRILEDFKMQQEENPEWPAKNFVEIAVRNSSWRIMDILKVTKID